EYSWVTINSERPDDFQMSHPEEKPAQEKAEAPSDNLSPDRKAIETTLNIADGQRGVSYARLFNPYLRGATVIKLVDPYIRYDYQIHNFLNFCETLTATDAGLSVELVTGADTKSQETEISAKMNELKESLVPDRIGLTWRFETGLHDRWIGTDTGWRILLGRGLDIFQKPEGKFTLGFVDQTKRRCKATTITYVKKG
ncbi:MAG: MIT C-terminal domain-containing protein, partial [Thermodesulfobacteriota bacterium]